MKRTILAIFVFLALPLISRAQTQTNVNATITDPSGIPYANGTFSIQLIPSGTNPSVGGAAIQGSRVGSTDVTGSFNISLWPNGSITPGGTTWQFTVCSNPGGIQPPLGTGGQCTPPTAVTISGASQSLSATLSAVAPKLTTLTGNGTIGGAVSAFHIPFASGGNALADTPGTAVTAATGAILLTATADNVTPLALASHSATQTAALCDFNNQGTGTADAVCNVRGNGIGAFTPGNGTGLLHVQAENNSFGVVVSNRQADLGAGHVTNLVEMKETTTGVGEICSGGNAGVYSCQEYNQPGSPAIDTISTLGAANATPLGIQAASGQLQNLFDFLSPANALLTGFDTGGNYFVNVNGVASYPTLGTSAEVKGASPGATAAANVTALQAALNVTGLVTLSTCGTYNINAHLTIKSNTHLRLAPCVKFFQANASNDNMLVNNAYANRGFVNSGTETYVNGVGNTCTPSSTQTVTFTNGNPAVAAIGTITINGAGAPTGTVTIGLPGGTNGGSLYQAAPTTGTITTCTGTATFNSGTITGSGNTVTLTYTSGMTVSVALTGHGLSVGQYVYLAGSSPSNFDGVFRIVTITDANNFVVALDRFPLSAPSGQAVLLVCDQHISVEGGTLDYNGANQTTASNQLADAAIFGFAQDVKLTKTIINNANKYAYAFGAVRDATMDQAGSDFTLSDEVKVFGPAESVGIFRPFGRNCDDGISFQTNPGGTAGFPQTNWSTGDIINAGVDGADLSDPGCSSTGAVVFYPSDTTSYMGGLYAKNISGTRDNTCVAVAGITSSNLDTVRLENINCSGGQEIYFNTVTIGTLEIDNETWNGFNSSSASNVTLLTENSAGSVNNLILTGCNLNNTGVPTVGGFYFIQISGVVNNFTVKNCLINGSAAGGTPPRLVNFLSGSSPDKITIDSVKQPNGDNFITLTSGVVTTPTITVRDSVLGTKAIVSALGPSANVAFFGNEFVNCSNGCIRTTGTPTVKISGNGNILSAGSWITIASGTPVFTYAENTDINSPSCFNVTPVTVNANTTADQSLMACSFNGSSLNSVGRTLSIGIKTVYSTPVASTATLNLKIKLCTVSGCGAGTVITPISITSSANPGTVTNNTMSLNSLMTTQTAGTSAAFEASGSMIIDLGALTTSPDTIFADTNTATVGTIDSTVQLFLQVTGAFSAASGSNSITERQLIVKEY